ncbi:MAG: AMP-binding protein [Deltaproteobacteria bacterium]|nr:AMP-binding protein [Deltaproteobacteria bacterium]NND29843.1 AMP-binding protein [Myxococcales bacterium]MBT8463433.1 AMP-binding protein [Deltaproteobacteria bacterium]MBT8482204.1 AMP-binding protein [Deltaproteobacteria bacterium]NNK09172.1 AMP-binding protein [Myxococcales bacterium]
MAELQLALDDAYHWESSTPDRLWMTQPIGNGEVQTYTWAQAMDEVRRMAAHLKSLNLPPGSHIGLISKNCAHFVLTDLAIWMAGHVSVALYPTLNAETIQYILEHSDSKLLFVGKLDGWDEIKKGIPAEMPCISFPLAPPNDYETWDSIIARTEPLQGNPSRSPEELAIIVYTSGSTGRPKGVMHSFGAIAASVKGAEEIFHSTPEDRMLSYLPLAHVFERFCVETQGLHTGMQLFFAESLDTFVADLNRAQPTIFVSVPRLWLKFQLGIFHKLPPEKLSRLLRIPLLNRVIKKKILTGLGLQHVRIAASGSAPIPPDLIQWYRNLGLELLEGYGMSEDFAYSHATYPGHGRVGYVGSPMPGVDVKISEEGEILIKSPGNMTGYYKQPEMTAECYTEDGYFRTGDRGERDEEGRLKITGRVKELFKTSKGKYVAPVPIENIINNHVHVEMCCVTGSGHPQPFALVLLGEELRPKLSDPSVRQEVQAELDALLQQVNQEVEAFERLQFLTVVKDAWLIENGFLTPTMKMKRSMLEDTYGPKMEDWYSAGQKVVWEA